MTITPDVIPAGEQHNTYPLVAHPTALKHWIDYGEPGSKISYHLGFLGYDRFKSSMEEGVRVYAHQHLDTTATILIGGFECGLLDILQRKRTDLGVGIYEYTATKKK